MASGAGPGTKLPPAGGTENQPAANAIAVEGESVDPADTATVSPCITSTVGSGAGPTTSTLQSRWHRGIRRS